MMKTKGWEVLNSILDEEIATLKQTRKSTCDAMEILSSVKKEEGVALIYDTISDIFNKRDKFIVNENKKSNNLIY